MLKGGCREQSIDVAQRLTLLLRSGAEYSPAIGNGFVHRQKITSEPSFQIGIYPMFEVEAFLAGGQEFNALANLPEAQDAGEERGGIGGGHPAIDVGIGRNGASAELRKNIRIQQKSGHKSTGRP